MTIPKRTAVKRSAIKRKPRKASKTLRIYGPPARRKLVKAMPCAACGAEGWSVNAHVAPPSEKGTGYKAGYEWIAPLCADRLVFFVPVMGCHTMYDEHYEDFVLRFPDFNAEKAAAQTEQAWQDHLKEKGK
jgi:hypothetical protein